MASNEGASPDGVLHAANASPRTVISSCFPGIHASLPGAFG
jgi:hypothetical protein